MTVDDLRLLHDKDLGEIDSDDARAVLAGRGRAATQVRVTLARCYGRDDMATARQWHVLPMLTPAGTIGVLDVAKGHAWDSGVEADPGVHDLGIEDRPYAAANTPSGGGEVRFDGRVVQRDGSRVDDSGATVHPSAPEGWRQIALPTWRGYTAGAHAYDVVPTDEYRPEMWTRPTLVAEQLMTCYGEPGQPVPRSETGKPYLAQTHGWDSRYAHGVPPWIDGMSVTVLDLIADADSYGGVFLRRTRMARLSDADEAARVSMYLEYYARTYAGRIANDQYTMRQITMARDLIAVPWTAKPWTAAMILAHLRSVHTVLLPVWAAGGSVDGHTYTADSLHPLR